MLRSMGQNPTEDEILNMVIEYDANGDGTIDFEEFIEMMTKKASDVDQVGKTAKGDCLVQLSQYFALVLT